jgi:hypothetical protein
MRAHRRGANVWLVGAARVCGLVDRACNECVRERRWLAPRLRSLVPGQLGGGHASERSDADLAVLCAAM